MQPYDTIHFSTKVLRRDFILAMIKVGTTALEQVKAQHPDLHAHILETLKNPTRAAFWMVSDRTNDNPYTPLQALTRGEIGGVQNRLDTYVSLQNRPLEEQQLKF